jgi:hypothetical protein
MLTKKAEDFLLKLRIELLFRKTKKMLTRLKKNYVTILPLLKHKTKMSMTY